MPDFRPDFTDFMIKDRGGDSFRAMPVPYIDASQISGGAKAKEFKRAAEAMETFFAEGGRLLPIVYGEHLIAGIILVHQYTLGSPNKSIIFIGLGDGQGNGGNHGEWEGVVAIYYNGALQSVSGDATTAGYRFYAGHISTGVASGPQQVDAFLPDNLAYSGTAYYAIKLTDTVANAEDRPDKLRGRFKGRKTYNFSATGANLGSSYSVNAARVAADRILAFFEHKYPNNLTLAMAKFQDKVNWGFWKDWLDFNAATISWNDGVSTVNIPRFECHVAFTEDVKLAAALDQICASSGAHWQDDGEQIIFLPPSEREPVHHFNESNIISDSVRVDPRDLRDRPNIFTADFRDTTDTFLGLATTTPIRRETMIKQAGEIKSNVSLPNMNLSQALRLTERRARLEADNYVIVALIGDETSLRASAGDYVTVTHPLGPWNYQRFLVLEAEIASAEEGPDTCEFVLQEIKEPIYSDTAHGPKQQKLSSVNPSSFTTPDTVQGGSAVTGGSNTGHGSTTVSEGGGQIGVTTKSIIWTGFPSVSGTLTALKLAFDWSEDGSLTANGTSNFRVQYSINGGSNWTDALNHSNVTSSTTSSTSVTLSVPQNLTQVQVRGRLQADSAEVGDSASLTASVSNIRLEVEFL